MKEVEETKKVQTEHGTFEKTITKQVKSYHDCRICSETFRGKDTTELALRWTGVMYGRGYDINNTVNVCQSCLDDLNKENLQRIRKKGVSYKITKCSNCGKENPYEYNVKTQSPGNLPIPKTSTLDTKTRPTAPWHKEKSIHPECEYWFCKSCAKELLGYRKFLKIMMAGCISVSFLIVFVIFVYL